MTFLLRAVMLTWIFVSIIILISTTQLIHTTTAQHTSHSSSSSSSSSTLSQTQLCVFESASIEQKARKAALNDERHRHHHGDTEDACFFERKANSNDASQALIETRDKYIVFFGESTLRQLYLQLIATIDARAWDEVKDRKADLAISVRKSGARFDFHYLPYFANLTAELEKTERNEGALQPLNDGRMADLLVMNGGLHDLLYNHENMDTAWAALTHAIESVLLTRAPNSYLSEAIPALMWIPPAFLYDEHLTKHRKTAEQFTNASLAALVEKQRAFFVDAAQTQTQPQPQTESVPESGSVPEPQTSLLFYDTFRNLSFDYDNSFDGMHSMERARAEALGLIRAFHYLNHDEQLWERDSVTVSQLMCLLTYLLIMCVTVFGEICVRAFYAANSVTTSYEFGDEVVQLKHNNNAVLSKAAGIIATPPTSASNGPGAALAIMGNHNLSVNNNNNNMDDENANVVEPFLLIESDKKRTPEQKPAPNSNARRLEDYEKPRVLRLPGLLDYGAVARFVEWYNVEKNQKACRHLLVIGSVLALVYLMDGPKGHYFIIPSLKHYSRDFFIFFHLFVLAIAGLTFGPSEAKDKDAILSRLQTDEWKGIMQIIFVMYHYFDAAEVYNLIRVFIDAYVWLTGFGNTRFFVGKGIFNATRIMGMLFRLNFLVFWVCLLLNQPVMHYYICPLHTFFFLMCYATWGIAYQYNASTLGKTVKLAVCLLFLVVLFELSDSVFYTFWWPLRAVLAEYGTMYNWLFRTRLDHYATWFGMVFAVVFDWLTAKLHALEARMHNGSGGGGNGHGDRGGACGVCKAWCTMQYLLIAVALLCSALWIHFIYNNDKYTYNAYNPYTAVIPILSYILVRNLWSRKYRAYYSGFLSWMGQTTLETYIFQYHLFMIDDAKSILTVIPGDYPLVNFVIVAGIYVTLSRLAFQSTDYLRNYYFPFSKDAKVTNLSVVLRALKYIAMLCALWILAACVGFAIGVPIY